MTPTAKTAARDSGASSFDSGSRGSWRRARHIAAALLLALAVGSPWPSVTADDRDGQVWITSWTGSAQGPYPSGAAVAQPDLSFAFPTNIQDMPVRLQFPDSEPLLMGIRCLIEQNYDKGKFDPS